MPYTYKHTWSAAGHEISIDIFVDCVANENLSTIGISNKNRIATHACIQLRKNWLNRHGILCDHREKESGEWEEAKNCQINIVIILVYDTTEKHWNSHWIFQLLLCGLSRSHLHQRNRKIYVMTMSERLKLEKNRQLFFALYNKQTNEIYNTF